MRDRRFTLVTALVLAGCGQLVVEPTPTDAPNGTDTTTPGRTPGSDGPGKPDDPIDPGPAQGTLTTVSNAWSLACTPTTIYSGTTDGHLFQVDIASGQATELLPAASEGIGRVASDGTSLFYTLPNAGEVHRRDFDGTDQTLTTNLVSPTGIAVNGADVFVGTRTGVVRVAKTGAAQTPETRVTFTEYWVGATALGIAIVEGRLLIAHGKPDPNGSGGLSYYTTTGTKLAAYVMTSDPLDVAASAKHLFFPDTQDLHTADSPLSPSLLTVTPMSVKEYDYGGVCHAGGRLYFTALGPADARVIDWVKAD